MVDTPSTPSTEQQPETRLKGRKGFFVLFGPAGSAKTTEALKTFQNALYLCSAEGLSQYFDVWLETPEGRASGVKPPKHIVTIDQYSLNGSPIRVDAKRQMIKIPQKETFEDAIVDVTLALSDDRAAGRPPRFPNVIIDEASVFWDRFFIELKAEMSVGRDMKGNQIEKNGDGRAQHGALQVWTRQVIDRFRTVISMGANLVAVCHDQEPELAQNGSMKRGGALMPNQRVAKIFAADAHMALLSGWEEGSLTSNEVKHVWLAHASKSWNSKARGISHQRLEELKYNPLVDIVREAHFEP